MRNRHAQIVTCMPIGNGDLDVRMCSIRRTGITTYFVA